ncbi:hypothetical protein C8R42DRAFT_727784 [Lentinula raphanica]|nr:hypothetical protein C8R42DRAFT_727784 [Lentinula raphanica]
MDGAALEASITDAQTAYCERCSKPLQPAQKALFVRSATRGNRRVCVDCYKHYETKKKQPSLSTAGRSTLTQSSSQSTPIGMDIRENVNRAQRGEFEGTKIVKAISSRKTLAPLPPNMPSTHKLPFPEHLRSRLSGTLGYNEAHDLYKQCQQFYHERAMSAGYTEFITLHAAVCHVSTNTKFKAVGDVLAVIPHISPHIGCHDLHSILYMYLLPKWLKYSRNVKLLISDTTLANDQHADILPRIPDINAIKDKCFVSKGPKRAQTIVTKPLKLFLHVDSQLVGEAEFRRLQYSEQDAPEVSATLTHMQMASVSTSMTQSKPKRKRSVKDSATHKLMSISESESDDNYTPVTKKTKRDICETALSINETHGRPPATVFRPVSMPEPLSPGVIRSVLSQQSISRARSKLMTLSCTVYPLPRWSWSELVKEPVKCQDLRANFEGKELSVTLDTNQKSRQGSFKMALTDCVTSEVIVGASTSVCLKRCFIRSSDGGVAQLPEDRQYHELSIELNCILWAKVLLDLVYAFMSQVDAMRCSQPRFAVPRLRFVDAALVIARREDHEEFYMMEECIGGDGCNDWPFLKYICNNSAHPILVDTTSPRASEKNLCARFLAFAQHVQYVHTAKLAFTSDFQGAGDLLTDPQIITHPVLGKQLFARGNVAFDTLLETHECKGNEFCEYYMPSREDFT